MTVSTWLNCGSVTDPISPPAKKAERISAPSGSSLIAVITPSAPTEARMP